MAGINIPGNSADWTDNVKIHTLDSIVEGNDIVAPTVDGDANLPLRALADRTARIKEMLDTFGIFLKISEFTHSGQNIIYNAPIRGDVNSGDLVSFNTNQYWQLDLTQSDSRNVIVGIADITNSRVVTGGLITIAGFSALGFTEGDPIYAHPTSPGVVQAAWSTVRVGQYLFGDVIRISFGDELDSIPTGSITSMIFNQSASPVGWTKKTDWANNATLLVGNTYGSGGTDSPTSWVTNIGVSNHSLHNHSITVNNHVITVGELAVHDHPLTSIYIYNPTGDGPSNSSGGPGQSTTSTTESTGGSSGHNHTATSGNNGPTSHSITQDTYNPKYQIMIACTKD